MYYLTELLNLPVVAPDGHEMGRLREMVIEPDRDPNLVQMLVYRHQGNLWQVPVKVGALNLNQVSISEMLGEPVPLGPNTGQLLLRRDVLDQQIIDVNGRKVVRANDVGLELVRRNNHAELRAQEVDVGVSGAVRRLFQGAVPRTWLRPASDWAKPRVIPWNTFDLVETDPARRVRLQITYENLSRLHPADAADIVEELSPAEREAVFHELDSETAANILGEVEPRMQRSVLEHMESGRAADIVEEMEPDEAADALADLPKETSEQIQKHMEPEEREEVADLLEYAEDTAGGHMNTEFVSLPQGANLSDAVSALRTFEGEIESINTIFLVDEQGALAGQVPLSRLLTATPSSPLQPLATEAIAVERQEREADIAELFDKYNLLSLPVVDETRQILGVITVDDVLAWLRSRA